MILPIRSRVFDTTPPGSLFPFRFLDDPVASFDEQRLVFGLSLLLRNRCLP
ncbi:MAG TPA: hypothetical protein VFD07_05770 [Candidatus Krumholzibacteria bacterium]|nr:hypothetical protein [Candidatus Krumholzibacteria bacterium]